MTIYIPVYYFKKYMYSEKEIREFIENSTRMLDRDFWTYISSNQILSEYFIREFQDNVNWKRICIQQDLSEEFLIEFIEEVSIFWLSHNEKIPKDVKERIVNLKKVVDQG